MTIQTLFRNVTLPLPLRLRALPEIDTTATLKTLERVQSDGYGRYVYVHKLLQPAAQ